MELEHPPTRAAFGEVPAPTTTSQSQITSQLAWPHALLLLSLLVPTGHANGQVVARPSGAELQGVERADKEILRERVENSPEFQAQPINPSLSIPEKTFHVTGVEFVGNTEIPDEILASNISIVGRTVTVSQLLEAAQSSTGVYRRRGFNVAQVALPPQDMANGVVKFLVLEGRLDPRGLEIIDFSDGRIDVDRATKVLEHGTTQSGAIKRAPYERALRLVDELPGVRVRSWLYPGNEVGSARLRTELHPTPLFEGDVSVDNYGFHSTGSERVNATLRVHNAARTHSALGIGFSYSGADNYFIYGQLEVPVGNDGLSIGGEADQLKYRVEPDASALQSSGSADHYTAHIRYPFALNANTMLHGQIAYSHLSQLDRVIGIDAGKVHVDYGTASLQWTRSAVEAVARTSAVLSFSTGKVDTLLGPDFFDTAGNFSLWRMDLAHLRRWSSRFYSFHALGAQTSSRNLNGYLRCHVGGPFGNRAYAIGEGSGDKCVTLDNEFVIEVGPAGKEGRIQMALIADAARLKEFRKDVPLLENDAFTLASLGLGARFFVGEHLELRVDWAHQLIDSPFRDRTGGDTDGRTTGSRIWAEAVARF